MCSQFPSTLRVRRQHILFFKYVARKVTYKANGYVTLICLLFIEDLTKGMNSFSSLVLLEIQVLFVLEILGTIGILRSQERAS